MNSYPKEVRFYRFRNRHGEVYVATTPVENNENTYLLGFSFCNPSDMQMPRRRRSAKGRGIAFSRLLKSQISIALQDRSLKEAIAAYMTNFLYQGPIANNYHEYFGVKPYDKYNEANGGGFGEWLIPFLEAMRDN